MQKSPSPLQEKLPDGCEKLPLSPKSSSKAQESVRGQPSPSPQLNDLKTSTLMPLRHAPPSRSKQSSVALKIRSTARQEDAQQSSGESDETEVVGGLGESTPAEQMAGMTTDDASGSVHSSIGSAFNIDRDGKQTSLPNAA
jgi:hypothetical protein